MVVVGGRGISISSDTEEEAAAEDEGVVAADVAAAGTAARTSGIVHVVSPVTVLPQ